MTLTIIWLYIITDKQQIYSVSQETFLAKMLAKDPVIEVPTRECINKQDFAAKGRQEMNDIYDNLSNCIKSAAKDGLIT